jgi:GDPmannose 4,6-dehydratase
MDFVLATGFAATIRDFLDTTFQHLELDWKDFVEFDPRYLRPTEVDALIGDASLAERELGWKAQTLTPDLAKIMVDADVELLKHEGSHWIDKPKFL